MGSNKAPKVTLYTNYGCPWAHRAQVALHELNLPFETEIIDLSVPRTPEYLAINPRGLVPSLNYNGNIITESAIVTQFLADAHPSHLLKASTDEGGPLQRARIGFFVDTYFSKINSLYFAAAKLESGAEKEEAGAKYVDGVVKEIEPLLADAAPYFGGSSKLTLAEVNTASFVIRVLSFSKDGEVLPKSINTSLEAKAPNFWKWASNLVKQESVTYIYDEKKIVEKAKVRFANLRKQAAAAK